MTPASAAVIPPFHQPPPPQLQQHQNPAPPLQQQQNLAPMLQHQNPAPMLQHQNPASLLQQNPPPQQHQHHVPAAVAPPSSRSLSFDEVSKLFSLPIAEAASILGVCTSVLKRICRSNGIIRWPYRKFLAGKTVEEIKRDAAREKSKGIAGLSKTTQQRTVGSQVMPSTLVGISPNTNQVFNRMASLAQDPSKLQQGVAMPGQMLQSQNTNFLQYKLPSTVQYNPARNIPTYMDEFKYGFPAKGLSYASTKWWGSSSNADGTGRNLRGESTTKGDGKEESAGLSVETSRGMVETDADKEDSERNTESSSSLCSLRKDAAHCGRNALKLGVSRSWPQKLGKRQKLALCQVFRSSLPDQWKDSIVSSSS